MIGMCDKCNKREVEVMFDTYDNKGVYLGREELCQECFDKEDAEDE